MASQIKAIHQSRAGFFKALGHPTRLFIVEELARGERCVCELQEMIDADFSTVSKHLSLLKSSGVVSDRKEGLKVFYRLRMPCITKFFDCIEEVETMGGKAKACCSSSRRGSKS